jgi:hypothetical protein
MSQMTVKQVESHLEAIRAYKSKADTAHSLEKSLWFWVLHAIANGDENPQELAQAVLKSRDIPFTRSFG